MRRIRAHQAGSDLQPTLGWDVKEYPVYSNNVNCDNYKSLRRDDDNHLLNIVKKSYKPATNQFLSNTMEEMAKRTGMKVAGYSTFGNGEKVLGYLHTDEKVNIAGFDNHNYMVIGNSFDYTTGFFVGLTNIVLRCTNAFSRIQMDRTIKHNVNMERSVQELLEGYKGYLKQEEELKETFEKWHGITMTKEMKDIFVNGVLDITENELQNDEVSTNKLNQRISIFNSINQEINDMGDNLYGVFNGITHYTTHVKNARKVVFGNVFGDLSNVNKKAFKMGLELAEM